MDDLRVFTAARIHTMDPGRPLANAVAVSGGRIVSVGSLESMQPWLRRYDHAIDDRYADRVLMPGFIDPHTHLRMSGTYMGLNYLGPIDSASPTGVRAGLPDRDAVLNQLRSLASEASAGPGGTPEPVTAWGYDPATQKGHLDRDMLDQISDTVPLWVCAYAPHIVYANTPMIELIGVDESTDMHGLGRYPDGRLNGWFIETGAISKAFKPVADSVYSDGFGREAIDRMGAVAKAAGVTTTTDMLWGFEDFEREWDEHRAAIDDGTFPLRMLLVPFEPRLRRMHGAGMLDYLAGKQAQGDHRLSTQGIKFVNDGSYPSMTLRVGFPGYLDGEEGLTGEDPWDSLFDLMLPFWKAGIQIHSHANGDETVEMTLDLLERLQLAHPRFDHRFVIEHYCLSTPAQARRLAALGGGASVNAYFVKFRAQMHADAGFGPDRSEATARLGSLERAGAFYALHSDFNLVVSPLSPLLVAEIAATRIGTDGTTVLAPGERISVEAALRAITVDAAYLLNQDQHLGSVEAGKLADFTVLADDPFEVMPDQIGSIDVVDTVVDGVPT
ncbi:MAG: putative amidohydrolase YtcJ [Acidimicrobiales bacterium]|jgi:predicted amidohydrolase YtcJ